MAKKILIVDDEQQIVCLFAEFLQKTGFDTVAAFGGAKAIDILKTDPAIDLMILDIRMPGVSGVDVVRELKKTKKTIPVVIISSTIGIQGELEQLKELGCTDIFCKPVDLFVLLECINKKLKN
ncbi:MAG: response regulator [Candidatus Omnitrophota bacterium]